MTDERKAIVRRGYDDVSYAYRSDSGDEKSSSDYISWLAELTPLLPPDAPVLDLGCGCGVPVAEALSPCFTVTGVDISPVQIGRARSLVPGARFLCADMARLDFAPESFAAVVAFYSVIHVPVEEQPALFGKIRRWLRPGGYLMATVGHTAWSGTEVDWLVPGATMFWSHADAATYSDWLHGNGFSLLWSRFIPEGDSGHTLLLARCVAGTTQDDPGPPGRETPCRRPESP